MSKPVLFVLILILEVAFWSTRLIAQPTGLAGDIFWAIAFAHVTFAAFWVGTGTWRLFPAIMLLLGIDSFFATIGLDRNFWPTAFEVALLHQASILAILWLLRSLGIGPASLTKHPTLSLKQFTIAELFALSTILAMLMAASRLLNFKLLVGTQAVLCQFVLGALAVGAACIVVSSRSEVWKLPAQLLLLVPPVALFVYWFGDVVDLAIFTSVVLAGCCIWRFLLSTKWQPDERSVTVVADFS